MQEALKISGVIAVLYSAFFFSIDHSCFFYTPINRNKMIVIVMGVISNIVIVGRLQKINKQAEHRIARLEAEKQQRKKLLIKFLMVVHLLNRLFPWRLERL